MQRKRGARAKPRALSPRSTGSGKMRKKRRSETEEEEDETEDENDVMEYFEQDTDERPSYWSSVMESVNHLQVDWFTKEVKDEVTTKMVEYGCASLQPLLIKLGIENATIQDATLENRMKWATCFQFIASNVGNSEALRKAVEDLNRLFSDVYGNSNFEDRKIACDIVAELKLHVCFAKLLKIRNGKAKGDWEDWDDIDFVAYGKLVKQLFPENVTAQEMVEDYSKAVGAKVGDMARSVVINPADASESCSVDADRVRELHLEHDWDDFVHTLRKFIIYTQERAHGPPRLVTSLAAHGQPPPLEQSEQPKDGPQEEKTTKEPEQKMPKVANVRKQALRKVFMALGGTAGSWDSIVSGVDDEIGKVQKKLQPVEATLNKSKVHDAKPKSEPKPRNVKVKIPANEQELAKPPPIHKELQVLDENVEKLHDVLNQTKDPLQEAIPAQASGSNGKRKRKRARKSLELPSLNEIDPIQEDDEGEAPPIHHSEEQAISPLTNTTTGGQKRKRVPWSEEDVSRLRQGVAHFGVGNWSKIRDNYSFDHPRSGVDLKDKWRNLNKKKPLPA